jgi:hypothetical protein
MPVAIPEPNQSVGAGGLLIVKSNEQLDREAREEQEKQNAPELSSLAGYVRRAWQAAQNAKRDEIEEEMLAGLRARKSQYSASKLKSIREGGGSEVYMSLTDVKCNDAEAWINDVLFPDDERSWKIKPSPAPDLPQNIKAAIADRVQLEVDSKLGEVPEELIHLRIEQLSDGVIDKFDELAKAASARMERVVDDQFVEGDFYDALKEAVYDIVTFPACFIRRGMKVKQTLAWSSDGVVTKPVVEKKVINYWYRVSPFDIYPAPDSKGLQDGYLIERHSMRRSSLVALKGVAGFKEHAIDLVLAEFGGQGLDQWLTIDQERADLEGRDQWRNTPDKTIDAIEFHGEIQGKMLLEWGMSSDDIKDPMGEYEANVWIVGPYVIKATLNKDPLLRRPYFKASFQDIPGAFWGRGVPKKMEDTQTICNGTARSLVNNVAISSGPQVEIFTDRISAGEDITTLYPWKIWQTKADPTGGGHRALNFDQPQLNARDLMAVYEFFSRLADDHTGIPAYGSSQTQQGAGSRAAAGIAMLMTVGAKGIKQVIKNIDKGVIEPLVERNYQWNMQFNPDESIKGDVQIEAIGAKSLVAREQTQVRRQEFLQSTANPFDAPLMGQEGRQVLLRSVAQGLDLPGKEVVPKVVRQIGPIPGQENPGQQAIPAGTDPSGGKPTDFNTVPNKA